MFTQKDILAWYISNEFSRNPHRKLVLFLDYYCWAIMKLRMLLLETFGWAIKIKVVKYKTPICILIKYHIKTLMIAVVTVLHCGLIRSVWRCGLIRSVWRYCKAAVQKSCNWENNTWWCCFHFILWGNYIPVFIIFCISCRRSNIPRYL